MPWLVTLSQAVYHRLFYRHNTTAQEKKSFFVPLFARYLPAFERKNPAEIIPETVMIASLTLKVLSDYDGQ